MFPVQHDNNNDVASSDSDLVLSSDVNVESGTATSGTDLQSDEVILKMF